MKNPLRRIAQFLSSITASQIKVIAASVVTYLYPNVNNNLRVGIVGALVSIYVLGTTLYKSSTAKAAIKNPPNDISKVS